MEKTVAPVILFVYNRPIHTQKTLEALGANKLATSTDLIIFSDGNKGESDAKGVELTRQLFEKEYPFKSVVLHKSAKNKGLAKSIIDGVTQVLTEYPRAIVLEDDLITTSGFLTYMNQALEYYDNSAVYSISGYTPPIEIPKDYEHSTFVTQRICSWGWATWKNRWMEVKWSIENFDQFYSDAKAIKRFNVIGNDVSPMLFKYQQGKISSWAIRFAYHTFISGGVAIYPTNSLVSNLGTDGSGTHMRASQKYSVKTTEFIDPTKFCNPLIENNLIIDRFRKFYNTSLFRLSINSFKRWIYLLTRNKH